MKYHEDGALPENDEVFVFGSNLAGIHGAGAAKVAHRSFGARYGYGIGFYSRSYAIPTKDELIETLPLTTIVGYIKNFIKFTNDHPELEFFITRVGCVRAGYSDSEIAPLFKNVGNNCNMPLPWKDFLE